MYGHAQSLLIPLQALLHGNALIPLVLHEGRDESVIHDSAELGVALLTPHTGNQHHTLLIDGSTVRAANIDHPVI